jgi:hypothetical protein
VFIDIILGVQYILGLAHGGIEVKPAQASGLLDALARNALGGKPSLDYFDVALAKGRSVSTWQVMLKEL